MYSFQIIFVTVLIDPAYFSYARARAGMIGTQSKRDLLDSVYESNEFNNSKRFVSQVYQNKSKKKAKKSFAFKKKKIIWSTLSLVNLN